MKTSNRSIYKHIFGPVSSRRLGLSLGVDVMRHKTCSLDCVYCECGKTTDLTIHTDQYVSPEAVKEELDRFLSGKPDLDFITFSGSGEPTLYSDIGDIIHFLKTRYPRYKVAVLTNGTLFYQPRVRRRILEADLVIASLDAASEQAFRLLNRPHPDLELSAIIGGLVQFRAEFVNQYWIEIFIVPGINDSETEFDHIKAALRRIHPDRIQLNSLDRPGTEKWVEPVGAETLAAIADYLGGTEIIGSGTVDRRPTACVQDICSRILTTISRRPCTAEDMGNVLGISVPEVQRHLDDMIHNRMISTEQMPRGVFYALKE